MATGCCQRPSRRPPCRGTGSDRSMPAGVLGVSCGPTRGQAPVCASFQTRRLPPDARRLRACARTVSTMTRSHARDTRSSSSSGCYGRVSARLYDQLWLRARMPLMEGPEAWKKGQRPWRVHGAEAAEHPQRGLEQAQQPRRSMLVHPVAGVRLLGVSDARGHGALHRPRAAGRVGLPLTARVHRHVRSFWTVCTVQSVVTRMTTDPWRLTQAMIAGRSVA